VQACLLACQPSEARLQRHNTKRYGLMQHSLAVRNTMIQAVLQPRPLPMKVSYVHLAISLLNAALFSEVINFTACKSSEQKQYQGIHEQM